MKKIMVVDNHPVMQQFMSNLLGRKGHEVIAAADGLSAIQMLENLRPDIFFIDLIMPNISGDKLCRLLRRNPDHEQSFIVMLSAIAMEQEMHPENLDADMILAKGPFDRLTANVEFILEQIETDGGLQLRGQVMGRDELFERQISKELLASKQHSETTLQHMSEGLLELVGEGKIVYANPAAVSIMGRKEQDLLSCDFITLFRDADQPIVRKQLAEAARREKEIIFSEDLAINQRRVSVKIIPVPRENQSRSFLVMLHDITEQKQAEEELRYLSFHDSLTDLYNRAFFEEEMNRLARQRHLPLGIIVCDINGLKLINDTLGHQKGDELLRVAAGTLKAAFRSSDILARIGGDEFAVLLPGSEQKVVQDRIQRIAREIEKHNAANPDRHLSFSIGHAVRTSLPIDMQALFKEADDNMYKEKLKHLRTGSTRILQSLLQALKEKDYIREGHTQQLKFYVSKIAEKMGLSSEKSRNLQLLAQFHDLGKVGISDRILFKSETLTAEEYQEMKRHCEIGHRIALSSPDLAPIADLILKHHEWWNGRGYPLRLKGGEIPIECRILAVAEAYDIMTNQRPYQDSRSGQQAMEELRRAAGTQFDPAVVEIFIEEIKP
ncbi:diguanylate cyclase (GGDEF)-like protein/PAS domain S-box-containing protein [Desulfosalsimonas propionicica]|uniref:Diguanylate cyclase (GGDEF)-like protein/PAS domain S-box-containing protein n=1 Tax=Desulfosalsimonas propionicica TaxID=332175 RepID=A0A7W0CBI0_9BACT|nr:diguanylate cyclase [Desulfosalsimonas propionicica]MBA2882689.1 diguanylate cyclase (GGDEF)-like protein/PAS domain S-box-containing protein [Desulfosalsimonas propionicica]